MAKIVTNAIYFSQKGRDVRTVEIEVVGDMFFIKLGRMMASLPVEKMLSLINQAKVLSAATPEEDLTPKVVEGEPLVSEFVPMGSVESGVLPSGESGTLFEMPATDTVH